MEILNHRHVVNDDENDDDHRHNIDQNQRRKHNNNDNNNNNNNNNDDDSNKLDLDEMLQHTFVAEDFVEGIFRTEPGVGTHYELYFRSPKGGSLQEQPPVQDIGKIMMNQKSNKTHNFYNYEDVTPPAGGNGFGRGGGGVGASTASSVPASDIRLKKVTLFRPFAPLQLVKTPTKSTFSSTPTSNPSSSSISVPSAALPSSATSSNVNNNKDNSNNDKPWINLILPLSGRIDKFRSFMEKFVRICVKQDQRVYLTVVYFGEPGLKEVTNILGGISKLYGFKSLKLVTVSDSTFSRGKGLQVGVEAWGSGSSSSAGGGVGGSQKGNDVLMFLCDVDIIFNAEFLERCRQNTSPGEKVDSCCCCCGCGCGCGCCFCFCCCSRDVARIPARGSVVFGQRPR